MTEEFCQDWEEYCQYHMVLNAALFQKMLYNENMYAGNTITIRINRRDPSLRQNTKFPVTHSPSVTGGNVVT
jgi:hypothetical protein